MDESLLQVEDPHYHGEVSAQHHDVVFSVDRGLRKDLFGRYKKKDGSRSRSRSPQRNDRPRGR